MGGTAENKCRASKEAGTIQWKINTESTRPVRAIHSPPAWVAPLRALAMTTSMANTAATVMASPTVSTRVPENLGTAETVYQNRGPLASGPLLSILRVKAYQGPHRVMTARPGSQHDALRSNDQRREIRRVIGGRRANASPFALVRTDRTARVENAIDHFQLGSSRYLPQVSAEPTPWAAVITIVVVALGLRMLVMFALNAHVIPDDWDFGYETGRIAASMAEGDGFSSPFKRPTGPTAWLAPTYPAILAAVFGLFGIYSSSSAIAILLINSLASALTCLAVFGLANRVFDRMTGILAAVAFALYPPSIWHSVNTIWDTTLVALLTVLLVHGLYRFDPSKGLRWACLYGLAMGLVVWVNPVVLALLPLIWLWIWTRTNRSTGRRLAVVVLVTLAAVLTASPWMVRNYEHFGRPYLRSNLGLELQLGNSDLAWQHHLQGDLRAPWLRGHPSVVSEELDRFVDIGEAAYVDQAMSEALAFIRDNPSKFLRLTLHRAYVFWLSDLGTRNEWAGNLDLTISLTWMRVACHVLPLPFLLIGLVAAAREHRQVLPFLGFFLFFPLVYYVTHVSERYRFPVEPLIVILASYGFLQLVAWLKSRQTVPNSSA